MRQSTSFDRLLSETRHAFDQVARDYDGPSGNNDIVQLMRAALWQEVSSRAAPPSRLLDIGCGTGLDAEHFARAGFKVVATDWSSAMVERTRDRLRAAGLTDRARADVIGAHELERMSEERFDCIYSDLGALNCVPDLHGLSCDCERLLRPGGSLVFSVIGRDCPWEWAHFALQGKLREARRRYSKEPIPVRLATGTVWTRYFTPLEFYRNFSDRFALASYRSLGLILPPPYLVGLYRRLGPIGAILDRIDRRVGYLMGLRNLGDHFLIVLTRRGEGGIRS